MPNRYTGLPRPPHGPVYNGWSPGDSVRDPAKKPDPPEGEAPLLEWYQERLRGRIEEGLILAGIFFAALAFFDGGFDWVTDWVGWLIVLWPIPAILLLGHIEVFAAGADWFSFKRTGWVRTYELTEVKLKVSSVKWNLHLKDSAGRRVQVPWRPLLFNRELWDLVYNGILHSAHARKIETNREARKMLRLP